MSDDDGWEAALDRMTTMLESGQPFCHLRFGDGELNVACGIYDGSANCDGVVYTDQIAAHMRRVFEEMMVKPHPNYVPGGTCVADKRHRTYLESLGYVFGDHPHRPNGWVPCHVIAEGVETLRTLPMIKRLRQLGEAGKTYLVGSPRLRRACASSLLEVSPKAINDLDLAAAAVKNLPTGSVVMYCAGTPGKVMAWDAWNRRQDVTYLDMGHFFDRAYGVNNRMWHDVSCPRRKAYDEHFTKLILE